MIDFHCHVLPQIDDGSRSLEETGQMLLKQQKQGAAKVVATPHFYANHMSIDDFLKRRERAYQDTKHILPKGMDLIPGAEVYYFPGMGKAEQLSELCIQGTNLLLVELPFAAWTKEMYKEITDIIDRQHCKVILAHLERYVEFQKKADIFQAVLDLPVIPQMNTGSFIKNGMFPDKRNRYCLKLVKERDILIGSDCHNMTSRRPNLQEGRDAIAKKWGTEILAQIDVFSERVLEKYAKPSET